MRNRTELVTNQLGSDFEENEEGFEGADDSDDWKPDPEENQKASGTAKKSPGKRKATSTKTSAKKPAKKAKKEESEDDESEEDSAEFDEEVEEDEEEESLDASKSSTAKKAKKPAEADARNFPDRQGMFTLYAYKGDLKHGLRANSNICLWRRDGQSLLQKYMRDKETSSGSILFNSSMVYSCWEDRRKDEFLEVKVKCVTSAGKDNNSRDAKVELLDIDSIEQTCISGKFSELDLEPYVSYADKKKDEDTLNGTTTSTQGQAEDDGEEEDEEDSEGEE